MGRLFRAVAVIVCLMAGTRCAAQHISGRVVHVHDGDSFTIIGCDSITHKVRLWGVDAPELKQPGGTQARDLANGCIAGRMVKLHVVGHEKYGRLLSIVEIDEGPDKGYALNEIMLLKGLAWVYFPTCNTRYPKTPSQYASIERRAQSERKGIWHLEHNTPPWEYRKKKK